MEPQFAPQYSPKERRRRLLLHGVLCVLMASALYWWVLPRIRSFATDATCETLLGVPVSTILIYGAFVGAPLAAAVLIVLLTARSSIEAIVTRRYPPPNRKVYRRVKVKRGWPAVALALVPAMFITYLCVLGSQGMASAGRMARTLERAPECRANLQLQQPTPNRQPRRNPERSGERPSR